MTEGDAGRDSGMCVVDVGGSIQSLLLDLRGQAKL